MLQKRKGHSFDTEKFLLVNLNSAGFVQKLKQSNINIFLNFVEALPRKYP